MLMLIANSMTNALSAKLIAKHDREHEYETDGPKLSLRQKELRRDFSQLKSNSVSADWCLVSMARQQAAIFEKRHIRL